jgi:ribosomal protein S18 acetylase RimI-like enzyme
MTNDLIIEQLTSTVEHIDGLAKLLIDVVEDGASIGFLPPLALSDALEYWRNVINPGVILFVARIDGQIVGSIQLHLCLKPNGLHRAEIAKLMVHPHDRRRGCGRSLMLEVEEQARQENRPLVVLDTREGDPSNLLYASLGYLQAGRIPDFARSANGALHATLIYYKKLY